MGENDRIREHLESTVLGTTPGSKESIEAMKVYNEFVRNENERSRNESEQRLKQNIHEDELVKNRDQAMIDDKHFRHQQIMEWLDKGIRIVGLITTTALTLKAIQDDKDGKPWFGPAKDFFSNMIRKGN